MINFKLIENLLISKNIDAIQEPMIKRSLALINKQINDLNTFFNTSSTRSLKVIENIENILEKNVIGDVIEIDANPEVYKNLLKTAEDEMWIYNGINVIQKTDKWLVLFY